MSYQQPPNPLESIMRGMQIRAMVENIKAQREARAQAAQLHQLEIEQHQRNSQKDQFNQMMMLQNIGAIPAAAGDTGQNDAAISEAIGGISPENKRPLIQVPGGQGYRLPSQTDQFKRAQTAAVQTGELKAAEKAAEDPWTEIAVPDELGGGTQKVPQSKKLDYWLKIRGALQKQNPDMKVNWADDATGKRTFFGYDPSSPEDIKILKEFPGVAKPQVQREAAGGLTPYQQIETQRANQKDIQGAMGAAQKLIDKATQVDAIEPKDPNTGPEWKAARIATQQAAQAYPDAIEAGTDANGYPYVKPKARVARSSVVPAAAAADPRVGKVFTAKDGKRYRIQSIGPDGQPIGTLEP
jgi:hypothetical protein